ncbi:MAG: hypothetical protein ACKVS6_09785 [Planctomycetota bacterium]
MSRLVLLLFVAACAAVAGGYADARFLILQNLLLIALLTAAASGRFIQKSALFNERLLSRKYIYFVFPAIVAFCAAIQTLSLPYFSDDFGHLQYHASIDNPFIAIKQAPDLAFFRPVVWFIWWVYARVAFTDPLIPRMVAISLFVISTVLVAPALRKFGVPAPVAVLAGALFGCHPAALETVAWLVNLYSLSALVFFLLTIAFIPRRSLTIARSAGLFVMSLCAFLSKEDTLLLPVVAFAAASRFRIYYFAHAFKITIPILLALATALALRFLCIGGFGGYKDPATGASLVNFIPRAIWDALQTEAPSKYFFPMRLYYESRVEKFLSFIGVALPLGFGAFALHSRITTIGVRAGLVIIVMTLAPSLPLLPLGDGLASARILYIPAVGFSIILASLIAAIPFGRAARWAAIILCILFSLNISRRNLEEWKRVQVLVENAAAGAAPILQKAPPGARFVVYGAPNGRGVSGFGGGSVLGLSHLANRTDLQLLPAQNAFGKFHGYLWFDAQTGKLHNENSTIIEKLQIPGTKIFNFRAESKDRNRCFLDGIMRTESEPGGLWELEGASTNGVVALPALDFPGNCKYQIKIVGKAFDRTGKEIPIIPVASVFDNNGFERVHLETTSGVIRPEGMRARIEILLFQGVIVLLDRIEIIVSE